MHLLQLYAAAGPAHVPVFVDLRSDLDAHALYLVHPL